MQRPRDRNCRGRASEGAGAVSQCAGPMRQGRAQGVEDLVLRAPGALEAGSLAKSGLWPTGTRWSPVASDGGPRASLLNRPVRWLVSGQLPTPEPPLGGAPRVPGCAAFSNCRTPASVSSRQGGRRRGGQAERAVPRWALPLHPDAPSRTLRRDLGGRGSGGQGNSQEPRGCHHGHPGPRGY